MMRKVTTMAIAVEPIESPSATFALAAEGSQWFAWSRINGYFWPIGEPDGDRHRWKCPVRAAPTYLTRASRELLRGRDTETGVCEDFRSAPERRRLGRATPMDDGLLSCQAFHESSV
jgi:hypothetical protein